MAALRMPWRILGAVAAAVTSDKVPLDAEAPRLCGQARFRIRHIGTGPIGRSREGMK
jgi:hypothetical protein